MTDPDDLARTRLNARIRRLRKKLEELDIGGESLDALVEDCAAEQAIEINGNGLPAQLAYLLRHSWTPEDIVNRAKMSQEDTVSADKGPP